MGLAEHFSNGNIWSTEGAQTFALAKLDRIVKMLSEHAKCLAAVDL